MPPLQWLVPALAILAAAPEAAESPTSLDLIRAGRADEARALARTALERARAREGEDPAIVWSHHMHVAWLAEATGDPKSSVEHASRALAIATHLEDPVRTGRSLAWLGWSYTSLGLYELALAVYGRAIELSADGDRIVVPANWGLSTQETGAIYARMGRLDEAAVLIERTTDFARRHGILTGVAEGGAHLARIALARGDVAGAELLAEEALLAAIRCQCAPFNTARARVVVGRVALAKARRNLKFRGEAAEAAHEALEYARSVSDRRHVAEAELLLSYSLPAEDLAGRIELVNSALQYFLEVESEVAGRAQTELGQLFLEHDQHELARLYLESGLEVSEGLFRKLDGAWALASLAELDSLRGHGGASLERWIEASERARIAGARPLLVASLEGLSEELVARGYLRLAADALREASDTLGVLIELEQNGGARYALELRRFAIDQGAAELHIARQRERAPPP